jgi:hypothetical protein
MEEIGMARRGLATQATTGTLSSGEARYVQARQAWCVMEWYGEVGRGRQRKAWRGQARHVKAGIYLPIVAGQARQRVARMVEVRQGMAGMALRGKSGLGQVWQARNGGARTGWAQTGLAG